MVSHSQVCRASQGGISNMRRQTNVIRGAHVGFGVGTWDTVNSNGSFTLSNNNLTANDQGVWATIDVICNTGLPCNATQDFSWFVSIDQFDGGSLDVGLQVSVAGGGTVTTRPPYYPSSASGALAIQLANVGSVLDSIGDLLANFTATAIGDYFQFRLKNGYLYIRKANPKGGTWSAWNGSGGTYSGATPDTANNGIPISAGFGSNSVYPYAYVESGQVTADFTQWGGTPAMAIGEVTNRFRGAPTTHAQSTENVGIIKVRSGLRGTTSAQVTANISRIAKKMGFTWPQSFFLNKTIPGQKLHAAGHTITSSLMNTMFIIRGVAEPSIITRVTNVYSFKQNVGDIGQSINIIHALLRENLITILNPVVNVLKALQPQPYGTTQGQSVITPPRTVGRLLSGLAHAQAVSLSKATTRVLALGAVLANAANSLKRVLVLRSASGGQTAFLARANALIRPASQAMAITLAHSLTAIRSVVQTQVVGVLKGAAHSLGSVLSQVSHLAQITPHTVGQIFVQQSQSAGVRWITSRFRIFGTSINQGVATLKLVSKSFVLSGGQSSSLLKQSQKLVGATQGQAFALTIIAFHKWAIAFVTAQVVALTKGVGKTLATPGHGESVSISRALGHLTGASVGQSLRIVRAMSKLMGFAVGQTVREAGTRSVFQQKFFGNVQQGQQANAIHGRFFPPIHTIQTNIANAWYAAIFPNLEIGFRIIGRATALIINGITQ